MKIESADFLLTALRQEQFRRDGLPEVAFVGRSNVGKSSLLNMLLQRKGLARTSSTPGRTQAVNYFLVNRRFYFVDLPGFGYAKASKTDRQAWAELVETYLSFEPEKAERRLQIVQLVDGKVGATELDQQAHQYFRSLGIEPTIVATKIDKVKKGGRARSLVEIRQQLTLPDDADIYAVSAETGEGVQPLWKGIMAFLGETAEKPQ
jgi:GTP-binding protein